MTFGAFVACVCDVKPAWGEAAAGAIFGAMDLHGRMRAPARELLVSLTSRLHCGLEERLTFFFELYDTDADGRLDRRADGNVFGALQAQTRLLRLTGRAARRRHARRRRRAVHPPALRGRRRREEERGQCSASVARHHDARADRDGGGGGGGGDAQRHHANTASGRAAAPRELRRRSLDISGRASLSPQHVESTRSPTPDAVGPPLRRLATVCGGDRFELIQRQAADFLQLLFVLDIDGDGALSYREWAQGVLSQPELLRCFVLAAPAAPPAADRGAKGRHGRMRRRCRGSAAAAPRRCSGGLMLRGLADLVLCCGAT